MNSKLNMTKQIIIFFLLGLFVISCSNSNKMIKGTNIPETETNKAIVTLLNKYNKALETMNVDTLLSIASKDYYDNAGTTDSKDDFGYSQLKEILEDRFKSIREIHQKMYINSIIDDNEHYVVNYNYKGRFLMEVNSKTLWIEKEDKNEIVIIKVDNEYKILKGM